MQSHSTASGEHNVPMTIGIEISRAQEIRRGAYFEREGRRKKRRSGKRPIRFTLSGFRRVGIDRVEIAAMQGDNSATIVSVAADQIRNPVFVEVSRGQRQRLSFVLF